MIFTIKIIYFLFHEKRICVHYLPSDKIVFQSTQKKALHTKNCSLFRNFWKRVFFLQKSSFHTVLECKGGGGLGVRQKTNSLTVTD